MNLQDRVRERWTAKIANPSAFTPALKSLSTSGSMASISENCDDSWCYVASGKDKNSNTILSPDSTMNSEFLKTSRTNDTEQKVGLLPDSFRCDAQQNCEFRIEDISHTEKLTPTNSDAAQGSVSDMAPSTAEVQANAGADPRFLCRPKVSSEEPTASSARPKKEAVPQSYKSEEFCITDIESRVRAKWAARMASKSPAGDNFRKTVPPKFEGQANSHLDPRFHCRPKVPTQKFSAPSTRPKKDKGQNVNMCDENFECDVWSENETSAKPAWKNCRKNPGHQMFCPVKEFTPEHLPLPYRKRVFLKGINSVADLTVRIQVGYTSKERPEDRKVDIFASLRGTRLKRSGTGFIHTRLFTNNVTNMEFPDDFTGHGNKDSGLQDDLSAKYDNKNYEERVKYFIESFFPSLAKERKDKFQKVMKPIMKIPRGFKGFFDCIADHSYIRRCGEFDDKFDDNEDFNHLYGYGVVQLLLKLDLRDTTQLIRSLPDAFKKSKVGEIALKICEIKELWFGSLSQRKKEPMSKCEVAYRLLSRSRRREWVIDSISDFFGNIRGAAGTPSGAGDYVFFRRDDEDEKGNDNDSKQFQDSEKEMGKSETEEGAHCKDGEHNDLNKKPNEYNDKDEGKQSDESEDEDEDDDEDYLMENLNDVLEIVRPCPCLPCQNSKEPRPKGYSINVLTARHVVYNREEAQQTVVDLFCDDETEDGKERLYGVDLHVSSNSGDFAVLMCATHDGRLVKKLRKLIATMTKSIEKMKSKSDTPLTVICSHPHGHFKHITVGKWTTREIYRRRDALPPLWTCYVYDTPTCPGSSGGPVLILGHKSGTLSLDSLLHPHHGHAMDRLNRSSRLVSYYRDLKDMSPKERERVKQEQDELYKELMEEVEKRSKEEMKKLREAAETAEGVKKTFSDLFKQLSKLSD